MGTESAKPITFAEFCDKYGLQPINEPIVGERIGEYVQKRKLFGANWAEMYGPFNRLQRYFGKDNPILRRLIYSMCDKQLQEESYKIKGGVKVIRGPALRKKNVKARNRDRSKYLTSLNTIIEHLRESAPFLAPYPEDDLNPLSGTRLRELLVQLKALASAERDIDSLKREDKGRGALYVHDSATRRYVKVGIGIDDPSTALLVLVWKAKEEKTHSDLSGDDLWDIASILSFWHFIPKNFIEGGGVMTLLEDRLKYYRTKTIRVAPPDRSLEYHPFVYYEEQLRLPH
jgi:hypothetical protein